MKYFVLLLKILIVFLEIICLFFILRKEWIIFYGFNNGCVSVVIVVVIRWGVMLRNWFNFFNYYEKKFDKFIFIILFMEFFINFMFKMNFVVGGILGYVFFFEKY